MKKVIIFTSCLIAFSVIRALLKMIYEGDFLQIPFDRIVAHHRNNITPETVKNYYVKNTSLHYLE